MGKKSRRKQAHKRPSTLYVPPLNPRPFAGLANEPELAAGRELLPAATLRVSATEGDVSKPVTFVTIAPGNAQGVVRGDGEILVSLQSRSRTADASHDLGLVTSKLLKADPGTVIDRLDLRQRGPQLQDLIGEASGEFRVEEDLGFWLSADERTDAAEEAIRQSRAEITPCELVPGQRATFWTRMNADFVRIVLDAEEDAVFDGLARLRGRGEDIISGDVEARFIGAFRMLGLVTPVWEFSRRVSADEIAEPVAALRERIDAAVADDSPLTPEARRAREGIVSRQVSVR